MSEETREAAAFSEEVLQLFRDWHEQDKAIAVFSGYALEQLMRRIGAALSAARQQAEAYVRAWRVVREMLDLSTDAPDPSDQTDVLDAIAAGRDARRRAEQVEAQLALAIRERELVIDKLVRVEAERNRAEAERDRSNLTRAQAEAQLAEVTRENERLARRIAGIVAITHERAEAFQEARRLLARCERELSVLWDGASDVTIADCDRMNALFTDIRAYLAPTPADEETRS